MLRIDDIPQQVADDIQRQTVDLDAYRFAVYCVIRSVRPTNSKYTRLTP